jgi:hypothetical protein
MHIVVRLRVADGERLITEWRMAALLVGLCVLALFGGLVVGVAAYRRRRLADVYRQEGKRLVVVAEVLTVGGLILAFVVLMIINNR